MRTARVLSVSLACFLVLGASAALAATLLVAPNGVDSGSCGAKAAPCLTITRAIANAGIDDTVVVAPGRYGDVDGNAMLNAPSEETPNVGGCDCAVEIGKRVTVVSRDGAAATVVDAGKGGLHAVRISADGAVFGKKNKGFTLTGASVSNAGLLVTASGTTATGNVFLDNPGTGAIVSGSRNVIASSRFFGEVDGFLVTGSDNTITESAATGTGGFSGSGFSIGGSRNTLHAVFATGNAIGISLFGKGLVVTKSVVVRNTVAGIDVAATGNDATISKTTIHSNSFTTLDNCGLVLSGNDTSAVATGNFWGAVTGPGPDPADAVCILTNGVATTTPFATKEHKTPTKPLR